MELRWGGWLLPGYEQKEKREWEQMALNCTAPWWSVPLWDQTVIDFLFEGGTVAFTIDTLKIRSVRNKPTVLVIPEKEKACGCTSLLEDSEVWTVRSLFWWVLLCLKDTSLFILDGFSLLFFPPPPNLLSNNKSRVGWKIVFSSFLRQNTVTGVLLPGVLATACKVVFVVFSWALYLVFVCKNSWILPYI